MVLPHLCVLCSWISLHERDDARLHGTCSPGAGASNARASAPYWRPVHRSRHRATRMDVRDMPRIVPAVVPHAAARDRQEARCGPVGKVLLEPVGSAWIWPRGWRSSMSSLQTSASMQPSSREPAALRAEGVHRRQPAWTPSPRPAPSTAHLAAVR
jgi:hypothetical protein